MSSANVLPSAPEYAETVQQLYPMDEIAQINAADFRLKKISDLQKELSNEADHYDRSQKKYKRTHSMTHISLWVLVRFLLGCHRQPLQQP